MKQFKLTFPIVVIIAIVLAYLFSFGYNKIKLNYYTYKGCDTGYVLNKTSLKCEKTKQTIKIERGEKAVENCIKIGGVVDGRKESENYGYCLLETKKCLLSELESSSCKLINK